MGQENAQNMSREDKSRHPKYTAPVQHELEDRVVPKIPCWSMQCLVGKTGIMENNSRKHGQYSISIRIIFAAAATECQMSQAIRAHPNTGRVACCGRRLSPRPWCVGSFFTAV